MLQKIRGRIARGKPADLQDQNIFLPSYKEAATDYTVVDRLKSGADLGMQQGKLQESSGSFSLRVN
jgi:hypothetical protein